MGLNSKRLRNVTLVPTDDPAYREFCREQAAFHQAFRPKLPPSPMQVLSCRLEEVIRIWLSDFVPLLPERVLSYEAQDALLQYHRGYREIDAVAGPASRPAVFFEIKVSSSLRVVQTARSQLAKSARIAAARWPAPGMCIIFASVGDCQIDWSLPVLADMEICQSLEALRIPPTRNGPVRCVHLPASDVWQQGCRRGLLPDHAIWDQAQQEVHLLAEHRLEKQALIDRGVPPEQWPDHLLPPAKAPAPTDNLVYDSSGSRLTFGDLLREARSRTN